MAAPLSAQVEEFLRQLDDMGVDHHIDVPQATRRLKANNNDVGAAMQEYWEHPDSSKYDASREQWDENQFSSDRDGTPHTNGASFTIQGPDEHPQSSFLSFGGLQTAAQSRPPSRASNDKSPHHIENVPFPSTGNDPSEMDDDLRQAMEISVRDQGGDQGLAPQQNGVTYTGQQFGPANREQYAPGEWDLVPLGSTSTKEILLDPEPAERKRDLDAPAFLRSGAGASRLGALLTIYHEIPLVKYTFLHQPEFLSDYGYDNDWWKGKPMDNSALVEEDGEESALANRFYYELHRLMAFLEKTERSYGSAEVLTKLPVMTNFTSVGSLEAQFFEVWRSFCGNVEEVRLGRKTIPEFTSLFSRGVPSEEASYSEGMDFAVLSLQMPEWGSSLETLYDLTDRILWSRSPLEIASSPYLSHLGEVVIFQLDGNESSKHVPIPIVWYPDRYLKENRDAALKMRQQQAAINDRIEQLTVCENKLTYHNPPGRSSIKLSEMFKEVLRHEEARLDKEDLYSDSDSDSDVDMIAPSSKYDLSADLKKFMANIDQKLQELKEEKEKAQITLRNLSKLYTEPSEDPKLPPLHPYTLRGVSTTNDTTYVCRRSEPDLIELDLDGNRSGPKGDQWWRIQYASSAPGPLVVEKTSEAEVLKAAETERTEDLYLVYASAEAMDVKHITSLPQSLENFVRADNLAFSNEFPRSDESQNEAFSSPKSPAGKRKHTHSEDGESRFSGDGLLPHENSQKSARAAGFPDSSINDPKDVIEGIDPFETVDGDDQQGQEMQERSNGNLALSMLVSGRNENNISARLPDNMDWEPVVEDPHVSEESAAVRRVNFKE